MSVSALQLVGALLACGAAGGALLLRDPRYRYAAMGLGLAAAVGLVTGEVWDQERFVDLRSEPGVVALGLLLGGLALGAVAALFARNPAVVAIAAFAVLPLRLPVQVGDETNFLLVPLYGVIAGAWVRGGWLIWRGRAEELQRGSSPAATDSPASRWLCLALATLLVVYAAGIAWSEDPRNGIVNVAFFLTPFAVLLALLRDLAWTRKLLGQILAATVVVALVFAAVAFWQYATRELILNKELKDANQLHLYFRANSVFRDPNVLGRYLMFAVIAVAAWFAWRRTERQALAGTLAAAALLAALVITYSLTTFAALLAGLAVLAWFRLGRWGAAIAATTAILGVAAVGIIDVPSDESVERDRADLAEASSGRTDLVAGGVRLFEDEPLVGQGSGAFAIAFRQKEKRIEKPVSHTEPVTVAAEQGLLGLGPYAAVVLLSVLVMVRPWPGSSPARAGAAACYAALLVHSLGYAGFAIDPATWALLALGLALRE